MSEYRLGLDEPWTHLNVRGNPVEGRRLTFQLADGTIVVIDVSHAEYTNKEAILARLSERVAAHEALLEL